MPNSPLRVLLVEDSPSDAELLQASLSEEGLGPFVFTVAESWAKAAQVLGGERFDVMLLDLSLPDVTGSETFRAARAAAPQIPIIVLTGLADEAMGLEAIHQDIQDYLPKGKTDGAQMARAIRYAIERKHTQLELRRAQNELEFRVQERTASLKETVAILQTEISYRKEAEEALRESEERYRTLFQAAPVGIAISNYRGEVIAFNQRLCAMVGMTPEEARATPAYTFYADPAQRGQLLQELRRSGRVEQAQTMFRRKDGSLLICLVHMEEIRLGQETVLMTIAQDITRQKQTERHLEGVAALLALFATRPTRKDYLNAVVKLLQDWCECRSVGIRLLDQQGRLPYAAHSGFSRAFLREESVLSLNRLDCACPRVLQGKLQPQDQLCWSVDGSFFCNETHRYVGPQAPAPVRCANLACLKAGYASIAQTAVRHHEELLGTLHLADRRSGRFPAETVRFLETIAPLIGEAISRFRIEESLHESEARFRAMFERHNAVMLLVIPKSGQLVDANPAAADFYGYPRERLRGMNVADLNPLSGENLADYRCRTMHGQREPFICTHKLASGKLRTVEVHASPIEMQGKRLLFSIIHDISERKLLEKQVLEVSEQERQRIGQDLHDSLGGKLTGVALMAKAVAQGLSATSLPEARIAQEIAQCVNESIGETRALSRGLCPVELGAGGLSAGLADLADETERRSRVACSFHKDKRVQVHDLFVDTHLFQIAREAVTNALRHAKARQIRIRLTQKTLEGALEIRDDGQGLPADAAASKGLGLRAMKYRAGAIGGQLEVRSSDQGTAIRCRFPVNRPLHHSENPAK